MMNADGSFLDRLCDKTSQAVKLQQLRCSRVNRGAWTALRRITMLHTGKLIGEHLHLVSSVNIRVHPCKEL